MRMSINFLTFFTQKKSFSNFKIWRKVGRGSLRFRVKHYFLKAFGEILFLYYLIYIVGKGAAKKFRISQVISGYVNYNKQMNYVFLNDFKLMNNILLLKLKNIYFFTNDRWVFHSYISVERIRRESIKFSYLKKDVDVDLSYQLIITKVW